MTTENNENESGAGHSAVHAAPVLFWKKWGETPLEALSRLRLERPELHDETLSYAGRLDPAAEGVLLVLIGDDMNARRAEYMSLNKIYEIEVLLGVATDTADMLGVVKNLSSAGDMYADVSVREKSQRNISIEDIVQQFVGTHEWEYPAYSSKAVDGKPLFKWAQNGILQNIVIPRRTMTFYSIEKTDDSCIKKISALDIVTRAYKLADTVHGDFRQEEIKKSWDEWQKNISKIDETQFALMSLRVSCASGAYMRTLAEKIGEYYGVPALAYSIKRIAIQGYK